MITFLALATAFCYALGAACQHAVAASRAESGLSFFAMLVRRPLWLFGNVSNAVGLVLQSLALGRGDLIYVQPLLLVAVVLSLLMTAALRRERPGIREWGGSALIVGGVLAFLISLKGVHGNESESLNRWLWCGGVLGALAVSCIVVGHRVARATLYAAASGLLFGGTAALIKLAFTTLPDVFAHWPIYAILVVTPSAFYWLQRAYQSGPLAASFPVVIALDPLVSAVLGLFLFGERVTLDVPLMCLMGIGILLAMAGIAILAGSRFVVN